MQKGSGKAPVVCQCSLCLVLQRLSRDSHHPALGPEGLHRITGLLRSAHSELLDLIDQGVLSSGGVVAPVLAPPVAAGVSQPCDQGEPASRGAQLEELAELPGPPKVEEASAAEETSAKESDVKKEEEKVEAPGEAPQATPKSAPVAKTPAASSTEGQKESAEKAPLKEETPEAVGEQALAEDKKKDLFEKEKVPKRDRSPKPSSSRPKGRPPSPSHHQSRKEKKKNRSRSPKSRSRRERRGHERPRSPSRPPVSRHQGVILVGSREPHTSQRVFQSTLSRYQQGDQY